MTLMLEEIRQQPEILRRLVGEEIGNAQALCKAMKDRGIEYVSICARGTSDNAATLAKYLLEITAGVPVSLTASSVFNLYDAKMDLSKWLLLGISQSGESTDVVEVVRRAKKLGALTAGITNIENSTLAKESDYALFTRAGEEKSVAATKTYTSTMAIIYLLASVMSGDENLAAKVSSAADAIESVFGMGDYIERVVERYRYMDECMVIARGINQATCQEAALKLAETCYIVAKPYSAADVQHGPIATVDEGFPVFLYAPPGKAYQSMLELSDKMRDNGAEMIIISTEDEILSRAKTPIKIPVEVDEIQSPLVYIVAGQLFAQYLSLTKGYNPDHPRHLSKVTKTM